MTQETTNRIKDIALNVIIALSVFAFGLFIANTILEQHKADYQNIYSK